MNSSNLYSNQSNRYPKSSNEKVSYSIYFPIFSKIYCS